MARQKSPPLSPTLFIAVGAGVAIISRIVMATDKENSPMLLFFWIGVALGIIGLGKLALRRTLNKEKQATAKEGQRFEQQLHRQEQQWQQQHQQPAKHNIISCPACGTRHYSTSNFCHKCGARLK